jgi:phage-related protein
MYFEFSIFLCCFSVCLSSDTILFNMQIAEKPINWRGSSLRDLCDESLFSTEARREAGRQLSQVQFGLEPDHWKPFNEIGSGAKEIIVDQQDGWYRVMYVAKFTEAVYVLHCFKKKTNATSKQDKALAKARYDGVMTERNSI